MPGGQLSNVVTNLRRLVSGVALRGSCDRELLRRFVDAGDETAFTALVERHAGLVLGVCHRVLRHEQDAEDACQATFLVLARKAASIRKRHSLASWLHGVALRTAQKLRGERARRRSREQPRPADQAADAASVATWHELQAALDEELSRLPATLQAPLALCYLEGKTRDEAAHELGWTVSTLRGRLERGRERLRRRLGQRGLTLSSALLATLLSQTPSAAFSCVLAVDTARAVLALAAAGSNATAGTSSTVISLAQGVLRTMFLTKVKIACAVVLIVGLLAGGSAWLALPGQATERTTATDFSAEPSGPEKHRPGPQPADKQAANKARTIRISSPVDGQIVFVGTEVQPKKADKLRTVTLDGRKLSFLPLRPGDTVQEGQLLAQLDDRQARQAVDLRKAKLVAAEADLRAVKAIVRELESKVEVGQRLFKSGAMGRDELANLVLTLARSREETEAKAAALRILELELEHAQFQVDQHRIRSPIAGIIRAIHRQRGEAVRAFETIFEIEPTE